MVRSRNTDVRGNAFARQLVDIVWQKGKKTKHRDCAVWRRDKCNTLMKYSDYGDTDSKYGWEIDHIVPVSKGGSDDIDNLQPLQWSNNRRKGDTSPWKC